MRRHKMRKSGRGIKGKGWEREKREERRPYKTETRTANTSLCHSLFILLNSALLIHKVIQPSEFPATPPCLSSALFLVRGYWNLPHSAFQFSCQRMHVMQGIRLKYKRFAAWIDTQRGRKWTTTPCIVSPLVRPMQRVSRSARQWASPCSRVRV